MLYKKYHRNFIRQFKKGVRFEYMYIDDNGRGGNISVTVRIRCTGEPMIDQTAWDRGCCIRIPVLRDDYSFGFYTKFTLIFSDGTIENVKLL